MKILDIKNKIRYCYKCETKVELDVGDLHESTYLTNHIYWTCPFCNTKNYIS